MDRDSPETEPLPGSTPTWVAGRKWSMVLSSFRSPNDMVRWGFPAVYGYRPVPNLHVGRFSRNHRPSKEYLPPDVYLPHRALLRIPSLHSLQSDFEENLLWRKTSTREDRSPVKKPQSRCIHFG